MLSNELMAKYASFVIKGSLCDAMNQGNIANFNRPSEVWLERYNEGALQLYAVPAYRPAFSVERSDFLLEPPSTNIVSWNTDLSNAVWLKGAKVQIYKNAVELPNGDYTGCRLQFSAGDGNTNIVRRTFTLESGRKYTLSLLLRSVSSLFGAADVIKISGGVTASTEIRLSELNKSPNKYAILSKTITTAGSNPKSPSSSHAIASYAIQNVQTNKLDLIVPQGYAIAANDLKGGQLMINGIDYLITSNTASTNGVATIDFAVATLIADGVQASQKAVIKNAPSQTVTVEIYCESPASIDWGGMQLEPLEFRTSMIYQSENVESRTGASCVFRHSPIKNLKEFGFYLKLNEWRGDGNIFDCGNLSAKITNKRLAVSADNVAIIDQDDLSAAPEIYLQIAESNNTLSVYVDGILKGRSAITGFRGAKYSSLSLTSEGVRLIDSIVVLRSPLVEGSVAVGSKASGEIAEFLGNELLVSAELIERPAPLITLSPLTVPGRPAPSASSVVNSVSAGVANVQQNTGGFVNGSAVSIVRNEKVIGTSTITSVNGTSISLANASLVREGDRLVVGASSTPGYASARFPFDPVDTQAILSVDLIAKTVTVSSVLSFTLGRAIIRSTRNQDLAEVSIVSIDPATNTMVLDNIVGSIQGAFIAQVANELIVKPDNYQALIVDRVDGVAPVTKYDNGIVFANETDNPVVITPAIKVYL